MGKAPKKTEKVKSLKTLKRILPKYDIKSRSQKKCLDVKQALLNIKDKKTSIRQAAKDFSISVSYLRRRLYGEVALDSRNGPQPVFSKDEEETMALYLKEMAERGMELRPGEFLDFVQSVVKKEERNTPFVNDRPSYTWYQKFIERNARILKLRTKLIDTEMADEEIQDFYETALTIVENAGKTVKKEFNNVKKIEVKESYADLVTETDKAVEDMLMKELGKKYPSHKFIGEETVSGGSKCELTDQPTWIIDPIDGTSNFVHSIQNTCISVALSVNKKIEIGIVHCPITNETYSAMRGQGAFCNREKLEVSKVTDLKQSIVIQEGGNSRDKTTLDTKLVNMRAVIENSHGIRSYGSAALDMCFVAKGNHQAYVEHGIHVWDIAAAKLIVEEAGGVVLDPSGADLDLFSRRVLATCTKEVADQLTKIITNITLERD